MRLLMPNGKPANSIDRIMLLSMWAKALSEEKAKDRPTIIAAGMGKPTFAMNSEAIKASLDYWTKILAKNRTVQALLEADDSLTDDTIDTIAEAKAAVDYDSPQGNQQARQILAKAATEWYDVIEPIQSEHVLLTVGGASGIFACFQMLKNRFPESYIATPAPYYTLYEKASNKLYLMDVMKEKGYQFTAEVLKKGLDDAKRSNKSICALLICDPNNPLSTVISAHEWERIAAILKLYPSILIILDEAYAEMQLNGKKYISLLTVAPELRNRIIIFRSATKGLSAAGERMAATLLFDSNIMQELIETTVNLYGHAPVSSQIIYATALSSLTQKTLDISARYHKRQVDFVCKALDAIGIAMPDPQYSPKGTFYVLCDLSELYGQLIPQTAKKALGKNGKATTDEEIAYSLLFQDGIMIAPLSYFGISDKAGYFRITCSEGISKLKILMQRLAIRLTIVREITQTKLLADLLIKIDCLKSTSSITANLFLIEINKILHENDESKDILYKAKNIKKKNHIIELLLKKVDQELSKSHLSSPGLFSYKKDFLLTNYANKQAIRIIKQFESEIYSSWYNKIGRHYVDENIKEKFAELSIQDKLNFVPWKIYIMMQLYRDKKQSEEQKEHIRLLSRL